MLSEAAAMFTAALTSQRSTFDDWLNTLPEDDKALFVLHANNQGLSHSAMWRIAKSLGARVSKDTLTGWRKSSGFPS